jgi:hypothetical protein
MNWLEQRVKLKLLDKRKQAKLQWLQEPSEIIGITCTIKDVKPAGISGKKVGIIEIQN